RSEDGIEESVRAALTLGMRDVFLDELLELARGEGIDEVLLQAATSNLPITAAGVARMLAASGGPIASSIAEGPMGSEGHSGEIGDVPRASYALDRLADLSLVHRFPDGSVWVHRWTAEGLSQLGDAERHRARCNRAGRYRWWRVGGETHAYEDAVEAVRNFLAGRNFD